MTGRLRVAGLIGAFCASLCFLALPLLVLWVPMSSWLHDERLTRAMLIMFLAMTLLGTYGAYRRHRKAAPSLCGLAGALLLVLAAWHAVATAAGWAGLLLLVGAALWDRKLTRGPAGRGGRECK